MNVGLPVVVAWRGKLPLRHASVKPAKCPDHPRAGWVAELLVKRLTITCFACARTLLVVPGPFRTLVAE